MSLWSTKPQLIDALNDPDNRVIALTGKWGTGKSHLWQDVKSESKESEITRALYVSLFGVADMNQLKVKIIQSAVPNADANRAMWQRVDAAIASFKRLVTSFHKGFSALDDLALLAVPSILKNRFLVLDDIERKHEKLSIDEILGFIDEVTQLYGTRLVLILNSDQLSDKAMWEKLREKVIDQEIQLDTSPGEAFDIAASSTPTHYGRPIKEAVETCDLTNIRIVRKVIRAINRILGGRIHLPASVLCRIIPSTTLLASIYYKGIENGPTFDFVLRAGSPRDEEATNADSTEDAYENKHRTQWKSLLHQLGISSTDEYEMLVVDYLETGLLDASAVGVIIDRYVAETELMETHQRVHEFREHAFWHHNMTEEELVAEARILAAEASRIDPYTVTWIHDLISDFPGGKEVGNLMLDNWLDAFSSRPDRSAPERDFLSRKLHPRIKAEFEAIANAIQAETTLYDACERIAVHRSWGTRQTLALRGATVQDFEVAIRTLEIDKFKLFMSQFIEMCGQPSTYSEHFGAATERFVEACRGICADPSSGRLGKLIRALFEDGKLLSLLDQEHQA